MCFSKQHAKDTEYHGSELGSLGPRHKTNLSKNCFQYLTQQGFIQRGGRGGGREPYNFPPKILKLIMVIIVVPSILAI